MPDVDTPVTDATENAKVNDEIHNDESEESEDEEIEDVIQEEEAKQEEELIKKLDAEEEKGKEEVKSVRPLRKKRKLLSRLESHNQPVVKSSFKTEPTVGDMVLVKQDKKIRLGEITELQEDHIKVQWYGTTSTRSLARHRWKFYPGWETPDGEIEYKKTQAGGKPALCDLDKSEIWKIFTKLTLQSTLPSEVVQVTVPYTL